MLTLAFVILLAAGFVRAGSSTNASLSERGASSVGAEGSHPKLTGSEPRSESDEVAYWHDLAVKRLKLASRFERQRNAARRALRRTTKIKMRPYVDACLSELIWRESRWDPTASNPTTGAYGLPQALPGSKMSSAGADWRTNPATQIRWMQGYVRKYGGSCGALAFQKAHGWY